MSMFCYQCEQTAGGKGCTSAGVCGKTSEVANDQDQLTGALIGLARASKGINPGKEALKIMLQGLFMTITNVNFDHMDVTEFTSSIEKEKEKLGGAKDFDYLQLWKGDENLVSLRTLLLLGMRGMGAYAWHAYVLGFEDKKINNWFFKGMYEIGNEHTIDEWLALIMEFGQVNLECMGLLDKANTETYGHPVPTEVTTNVEKGPFIVITGHDLLDLKHLLEQTKDKGINIYTHGEMLPAHGYPELKKYTHLKGNYGTAWQNQKKEFDKLPGAVFYTTNCLMPPLDTYSDRIFTTSVVGYPGLKHIDESDTGYKDFTPVINKALELGGWSEDKHFTGINGGDKLMTGFGRNAVLSNAGTIVEAVKNGAISHFFLVGGCDGAKPGRNYYTDFVKKTPDDSIILTLACGKFRFNDLDLGKIGPFPRILDMGQCNDSYSAVQVAVALAEAFECGVNDLPLSIVLSWYEQKAVCVLLSLLSLGIKDIYLGPTLPAFVSPAVLDVLVEKFNIHPTTYAEDDLNAILKK